MEHKGKNGKRCLCCKKVFVPDPRARGRQRFCSDATCQGESKRRSQERWCRKTENKAYWRGPDQVRRVQVWRRENSGFSKKRRKDSAPAPLQGLTVPLQEETAPPPLQDVILPQDPLLVGLVSLLTRSTLQDEIAKACRDLIAKGRAILHRQIVVPESHPFAPHVINPTRRPPPPS